MKTSRATFLRGLLVIGALLMAVSAFWTGNAYAATGCFNDTNGHWAETFICWMKDNNITSGIGGGNYGPEQYVTRAQMAVFMQRQAEVPPSTGNILVTMSPDDWVIGRISANDLTLAWNFAELQVTGASTGGGYIIAMPDLPVSMYGRALSISGVEICYGASASVYLSTVDLFIDTQSTGMGTTYVNPVHDATDRTDNTCRLYTFTPVTLSGEKLVSIKLTLAWTAAGTSFYVGRTTFLLAPTTTTVPPLDLPGPELEDPLPDFSDPRD